MFQSTRPRGARRGVGNRTRGCNRFNPRAHAGRDNATLSKATPGISFNPRAHAGRDRHGLGLGSAGRVSIHAPTRGATPTSTLYPSSPLPFQSTRPRGARRRSEQHTCRTNYVSIHAPTRGATFKSLDAVTTPVVSIHAPTRGATIARGRDTYLVGCFNPRAHAGRDESVDKKIFYKNVSIHAPTRGATS